MQLPGYADLRLTVKRLTGIDLEFYRGTQLDRRLQAMLQRTGVADLAAYATLLETDPEHLQAFSDWFTIGVTEFFRNPDKFRELEQRILPGLLETGHGLRIWSAGCSSGAEPYSVAILLAELDPAGQHHILATDIDAQVLERAREGVYEDKDLRNVSRERIARFFARRGDLWGAGPDCRRWVEFRRHNLLADAFGEGFDLILCRNVVIYFTDPAKEVLYRRFHRALRPGGILFVGGTESLLKARDLGYEPVLPFFYRAVKSSVRAIS